MAQNAIIKSISEINGGDDDDDGTIINMHTSCMNAAWNYCMHVYMHGIFINVCNELMHQFTIEWFWFFRTQWTDLERGIFDLRSPFRSCRTGRRHSSWCTSRHSDNRTGSHCIDSHTRPWPLATSTVSAVSQSKEEGEEGVPGPVALIHRARLQRLLTKWRERSKRWRPKPKHLLCIPRNDLYSSGVHRQILRD